MEVVAEKKEIADRFDLRDMKNVLVSIIPLTVNYDMERWTETRKTVLGEPLVHRNGMSYDARFSFLHMWSGPSHTVRHMLLAYGLLRGRSYISMENTSHDQPDAGLILTIIKKFAPASFAEQWDFVRVREAIRRDTSDV